MSITPGDLRTKTFAMTADGGYVGDEVREYLESIARVIEDGSDRTPVGGDALLSGLKDDARAILAEAQNEADDIRMRARREALALLEASRRDAEDLIRAAQDEYEKLRSRATAMRSKIRNAESALGELAAGTLPRLEDISTDMTRPEKHAPVAVTVVPDAVVGLEMLSDMSSADMDFDAAVDLLLAQFREYDAAGMSNLSPV